MSEKNELSAELVAQGKLITDAIGAVEVEKGAVATTIKIDAVPFFKFMEAHGVTEESETKRREGFSQYYASTMLGAGETANTLFEANKDLKTVTAVASTGGRDSIEFNFKRSAMVPNGNEQVEKFGVVTGKTVLSGTSGKSHNVVSVKQHLSESAKKRFGS